MEDRLQKFATLVDAETFTKAAELLHISQPGLTAAIQKLERQLGVELLVRNGNRFRLTSAGRLAYAEGKELLVRRQNLKQQVADLRHEKISLAFGMIDSIAQALFANADALDGLERIAEVSLTINNSAILRQDVVRDQLDFAIVARQSQRYPKTLEIIELGSEPLVFVTHPDLLASVNEAVEQGRLPRFLSYNQASTTHQLVVDAAARQSVVLEPNFYSTSPEIILKLVLDQKGVAALPQLLVKNYIESGELTPIFVVGSCQANREIVALKPNGRILPPAAMALLNDITEVLRQQNNKVAQYSR